MLPVARDILHLQVLSDELASPRETQGTVRTNFQFLQESFVLLYMYINFHSSVFQMRNNMHRSVPSSLISHFSFTLAALTVAVLLLSSRWYLLSGIINISFHISDTAWAAPMQCCLRSQSLPAWIHYAYNTDTVPRGQLASYWEESSQLLRAFSGVPDMGHMWTKDRSI